MATPDPAPDTASTTSATDLQVQVSTHGPVADDTVELAETKLLVPAAHVREPVRSVRARIFHEPDPARPEPWRVEATIDVDGAQIRAHAYAAHSNEAVDLATDRLQRRVERFEDQRHQLAERRERRRAGRPPAPLAVDEEIERHKTFAPEPMTEEEARFDREVLDHAFYLYVDEATGAPALVVASADGDEVRRDAPGMAVADAIDQLEVSAEPFVFFTDESLGAAVLYRRLRGGVGLVTLTG